VSEDFLQGENLRYDQAAMVLVHCSHLGGVDFGEVELLVLPWWC
jgi:hypothetical protein